MRNVIAYSNGKRTLLEIAQKINKPIWELYGVVDKLVEENILQVRTKE
jgi:aminopeptidase-like protein